MAYWLIKSEPDVYSIDDLKRDGKTGWEGLRNYQARNFMKDMKVGDAVLFYHSSCDEPGVYGLATITKSAYADPLQFDEKSEYFDRASTKAEPRWVAVELKFKQKLKEPLLLDKIRTVKALKNMKLLQKGSRLSVQPVTHGEFNAILEVVLH